MSIRSLRTHFFIQNILPISTICLLCSLVFLPQHFHDLKQNFLVYKQALSQQSTHKLELKLHQRNLKKLALSMLKEEDIRSITIYDNTQKQLLHVGPNIKAPHLKMQFPLNYGDSITLQATNSFHVINPVFDFTDKHTSPSLWLNIEYSTLNLDFTKYQTIFTLFIIFFFGIFLSAISTYRLTKTITNPIKLITHKINAISQGYWPKNSDDSAIRELHDLQISINDTVGFLVKAETELKQNASQATGDLQETLDTIETQNIELNIARKAALKASKIKSDFLANMSHEIRTPLNGIIGFTKLLLNSNLSSRQQEQMDTIKKSSQNLLSIINDILDFSKIEAGKLVLDPAPTNIQTVIDETFEILSPQAQGKNLELIAIVYEDVPNSILADALRLKQILTNLIGNAIHFTQTGCIIVRCMLEDQKDNKTTLKITVSDTGIGLSENARKELFEAFTQAHSNQDRMTSTGLGLSISKRLVAHMHGEIGVDSELGKGSTFWFTLRVDTGPKTSGYPSIFEQKNILLYEPNPTLRLALKHHLIRWKAEVKEYTQLKELYNIIKEEHQCFSACIIGLNNSHQDNEHILTVISALSCKLNYPVFVFNNNNKSNSYNRKLEFVASSYNSKPITAKKLYTLLKNTLSPNIQYDKNPPTPQKNQISALAVDDNEINLLLIVTLLSEMGITVSSSKNGEDAIVLTKQKHFDLIFMDIKMPGMNGIETAQLIRKKNQRNTSTPIIALTAHAMSGEKQDALKAGINDYITKPINDSQLIHCIQKWGSLSNSHTQYDDTMHFINIKEIINIKSSIQHAGGKIDLAEEMFSMLIKNIKQDYAVISDLHDNENFEDLLERIHKLHGASLYCGAPELQTACSQAEENLSQQLSMHIEKINIKDEVQTLLAAIENVIQWSKENPYAFSSTENAST